MRRLLVVFVALSLSGCVSLPSVLNPFSDDKVSVEVQAGKSNEKTTGVKVTTNTEAGNIIDDANIGIIEASNVSIDERVPFWIWLLMIIGWLLPNPQEIWKGLGNLFINIRKFIKSS